MFLLLSLAIVGWVSASALGTQAHFRGGEQPHARGIRESFVRLTAIITGRGTDLSRKAVADQASRTGF
ncbi:hypothetical protein [Acaryochloris thomasi]|uniref:hypothetical protein n=1 Tax=Acaryochloris thomasi TaxID=2929456 RepID=UPI000DA65484|nr:hypothetical protein [Acaryochloris thomasi]